MKKVLGFAAAVIVCLVLVECLTTPGDDRAGASTTAEAVAVSAEDITVYTPPANPAFDPDAVAAAEARMWKAYYGGNKQEIGRELIGLFQKQFGIGPMQSATVSLAFAEGAMTFQRGDYDGALPPLRQAYAKIRAASGRNFDPDAAAQAELDWWVARRTPGENSAENVGVLIARLYATLYGESNAQIERAGQLRAEAARLRDEDGDWDRIEELLRDSYRALVMGVSE
ncbi:MAG: hypothetical protein PWP23_3295 [Candidatus Sumerlaeota bacterium]|nr:hypothetical protein [Candidatus Sumerlaeota bacterium]